MARRKRAFIDDDDDSSEDSEGNDFEGFENEDPDTREERRLFEQPYKKQRRGGKEDAIYGVFADDDEDEGFGKRKGKPEKRLHFTQAPAFVTGDKKKVDLDETLDIVEDEQKQEDGSGDEDAEGSDEEESDSSAAQETPPPVHEEESEEVEERPIIGLKSAAQQFASTGLSQGGLGFSKGGIGSRGGIGSKGGIGSEATGSAAETQPSGSLGGNIGIGIVPARGGIGSSTGSKQADSEAGPSERAGGLDFASARGGIGSSKPVPVEIRSKSALDASVPSAFGGARQQRSFLREGSAPQSGTTTPKLSRDEQLHFSKLQGSFGAKLMAKMGWQMGTGLGTSGEGIVTPVETKLRPKQSMGLAFKGFKEKTAQSIAEAKRRGEIVSEDEEEKTKGKQRRGKEGKPKSDAWKKPKRTKVKVQHQTYEEILQNAGQDIQPGIGKIYDATGKEISLADMSSATWTPSTDNMRIPEIRHNLKLIVDAAKSDLDGLVREAKAVEERKIAIEKEDARLRKQLQQEAELISRLQNVHLIVDDIKTRSEQSSGDYEPSLEAFSPPIERLLTEFAQEYDQYHLDEIVVAAITPVVRRLLASWHPLEDSTLLVDSFRRWRRALKFTDLEQRNEMEVDIYGAQSIRPKPPLQDLTMTPYESLMWNIWLPKVRSAINNEWSPVDPDSAIRLYESWSSLLPPFIRDNVLDQLILPKVQKGIAEWQLRSGGPALQSLVFPWLPHIGLRIDSLLGDAKRKVKGLLRGWVVGDGVPLKLAEWKDVFGLKEWDSLMLKYIVPKLGSSLREDFKVNPRRQDMTPLEQVLQWRPLIRSSVFSQILEMEFFPKWLDVLYIWLIQPKTNFEEVAQWYAFWKSALPQEVLEMPGVTNGFTRGLQLMNKALELGPDAPTKLPRPEHGPPSKGTPPGSRQGTPAAASKPRPPVRATEITFRSIVEEYAASHDLLFMPTGRAHEKSRMPLFRVSHNVDGKGGILVFILDNAVWVVEGDDYRAISLEEMVVRANKSR